MKMTRTDMEQLSRVLHRALSNISQSMTDRYIEKNAQFRYNAGLSPQIIRTSSGHCCEWCNQVAGKYSYPDVPKDVYRRHDNCDCTVEYVVGKKSQNIWTKKWNNSAKNDIIENNGRYIKLRINLFSKSDELYAEAFSIEEEPPYEDVCCHGNNKFVEVWVDEVKHIMTAQQFADYIRESGKFVGQDLRFNSCSVGQGENSFAQQLSKILSITVKAPDDDAYYDTKDGVIKIGSPFINIGSWRIFRRGVEIT